MSIKKLVTIKTFFFLIVLWDSIYHYFSSFAIKFSRDNVHAVSIEYISTVYIIYRHKFSNKCNNQTAPSLEWIGRQIDRQIDQQIHRQIDDRQIHLSIYIYQLVYPLQGWCCLIIAFIAKFASIYYIHHAYVFYAYCMDVVPTELYGK